MTNYGPIGVLWFDGEWVKDWTEPQGKALYAYVRSLQPTILVNNRVGKGRKGMEGLSKSDEDAGDFGTPEQQVPGDGPSRRGLGNLHDHERHVGLQVLR